MTRRKPGAVKGPRPRPPEERFWAKVNKDGPVPSHRPELGQCWVWTRATTGGYGVFRLGSLRDGTRRMIVAHRFAHELLVGPVPEGLELDHLCRNRMCVKAIADEHGPSHLEPVTGLVNNLRGESAAAQHARATHCPQGHPYDLLNTYYAPNGWRQCRTCIKARGAAS